MARLSAGVEFANRDGIALKGDLYAPDAGREHAVVVAAPGGAWLRGDKADIAHWGERLAEAGIAMFSIDYRRSSNGKVFPGNAQDVLAAINFVHANANALGVDNKRLGVMGASAGAHLAALAVLAGRTALLAGDIAGGANVRVFVGVYGVYDLVAHWRACQAVTTSPKDDMADRMMGGPLIGMEAAYRDASPLTYTSKAHPQLKVLLAWGDADATVLPGQSEQFAAGLRGAGVSVETNAVRGAGHFWFSKDKDTRSGANGMLAPHLLRFLDEALVHAR